MVGSYGVFNIFILPLQHTNDHIFQTSFVKFYKEEGGTTTSSIFKVMHAFLAINESKNRTVAFERKTIFSRPLFVYYGWFEHGSGSQITLGILYDIDMNYYGWHGQWTFWF